MSKYYYLLIIVFSILLILLFIKIVSTLFKFLNYIFNHYCRSKAFFTLLLIQDLGLFYYSYYIRSEFLCIVSFLICIVLLNLFFKSSNSSSTEKRNDAGKFNYDSSEYSSNIIDDFANFVSSFIVFLVFFELFDDDSDDDT